MEYKKTLGQLYKLESSGIKLGLENIKNLLEKSGSPQHELKCIHVAGTNGKGSVASMIFFMLMEAGYNAGLYTSPHLKRFNERIRINEHFISNSEIVHYYLTLKPYLKSQSFFEVTTAMAFLYFRDKKVDYAVIEVGLGGRLDATNVVTPLVSVITNIGLEHTDLLGGTIEKIALEKAGIIKENVPVVAGAKGMALKSIEKIAKVKNAPLFVAKKYPNIDFKHLNGFFQQENKDIALTTMSVLKKYKLIKISQKHVINGIKKTKWKGRLEFIAKNVLADCAHNADGFKVLKKELEIIKKRKKIRNFIFVIGILKTKNAVEMLHIINPLISKIIFTKSKNEKSFGAEELKEIFKKTNKNKKIEIFEIEKPKKALNFAKKICGKNDLVVCTGSVYMIGEII